MVTRIIIDGITPYSYGDSNYNNWHLKSKPANWCANTRQPAVVVLVYSCWESDARWSMCVQAYRAGNTSDTTAEFEVGYPGACLLILMENIFLFVFLLKRWLGTILPTWYNTANFIFRHFLGLCQLFIAHDIQTKSTKQTLTRLQQSWLIFIWISKVRANDGNRLRPDPSQFFSLSLTNTINSTGHSNPTWRIIIRSII
jgi:hypothetical protein